MLPPSLSSCLAFVPAVELLRRAYPAAELWGVAWDREFAAEQPCPEFDRWLVLTGGWSDPIAALRLPSIDLVIDLSTRTRGGWFSWLCRGTQRVSPAGGRDPHLADACPGDVEQQPRHVCDDLRQALDIPDTCPAVSFDEQTEHRRAVQRRLESMHLLGGFVALQADRSLESVEGWSAERYGRIAKRLGQRYQLPSLLIWHGASGPVLAQRAALKSGGNALVNGPASLSETRELIRQARAVVSMEQGMLAVGADLGTPVFNPSTWLSPLDSQRHLERVSLEAEVAARIYRSLIRPQNRPKVSRRFNAGGAAAA